MSLMLNTAHVRKRASFAVGVTAVAVGLLSVACGSHGTPAPTSTTSTTTTTTTSSTSSGGGHHEKHDSGGSGGGGAAPVQTETVAPSTVTNTETDVQTTVQTSVATETQTVTATPTYQPHEQFGRNDNHGQFGPQQGH
jgi:hypothetical protein